MTRQLRNYNFPLSLLYWSFGFSLLLILQGSSGHLPALLPPIVSGPDWRALPADVAGLPEMVEQRTATTATFDHGNSRYTTIASTDPLHYQDDQGAWQIIDPAFRPLEDSFVVEHNSLRSRAGLQQAWVSLRADEMAVHWQAQTVGTTGHDGAFTPLAHALAQTDAIAELNEEGRVLHYKHGWSDPTLAEEFISTAGALEHILILPATPEVTGQPEFLEMQATLRLLPGVALWAEGEKRDDRFVTAGALEIRDAEGEVALVFDPVVAFEQANPATAIGGEYAAWPGAEAGVWTIGVRTPWAWWAEPDRVYPIVLDPTMHVTQSTGYGNGLAWIGDKPGTPDEPYRFNEIILGTYYGYNGWGVEWPSYDNGLGQTYAGHDSQAEGYVQFNTLPGLLQNSPMKIKAAYIDVQPLPLHMPYYKGSPDWDEKVLNWQAEMFYIGACPTACPNGFSLQDDTLTGSGYTWDNRPLGTALAVESGQTLTTDPILKWQKSGWAGKLHTTSWDVTQELLTWYNAYYTDPARPKPTFGLKLQAMCGSEGPYVNSVFPLILNHPYAPGCSALVIPAGNISLRIDYETLALNVGDNVLNTPGVPGFAAGVFEDTVHQHKLVYAGGDRWRGVAVRGNHGFLDPNPTPARLSLQISEVGDEGETYLNASPQAVNETVFAFIDDHSNSSIGDLQADIIPSDQNDLSADPDRNYRIEYIEAAPEQASLGTTTWNTIFFKSDRLLDLREFTLTEGDNLLITVNAPPAIEPLLLGPTGATLNSDAVIGLDSEQTSPPLGSGQTRAFEFGNIPVGGSWALAFINQAPPVNDPFEPGYPDRHEVNVSIQRCFAGTIPTARYECQPLILPDEATPSRSLGSLIIYSEEGFIDSAGGEWCSKDGDDLPTGTIPPAVVIGPSQNDRWIYVAQGKICYIGGELFTTEESAVGLAVPIINSPPGDERGRYVLHTFGSAAFYPLPLGEPKGMVKLDSQEHIVPYATSTRIGIQPFEQYWQGEYNETSIYIDPAMMVTESFGALTTAMTLAADQSPLTRTFDTEWQFYPQQESEYQGSQPRYHFPLEILQKTPLPDMLNLSSLSLRILNSSNAIDSRLQRIEAIKRPGGPSSFLLLSSYARITQAAGLGGASKTVQVVVNAPGKPLQPISSNGEKSCAWQGSPTSCLDIRRDDYQWQNGKGEKAVKSWELPDIHLEDSLGTLALSTPGALTVFSADHPHAVNDLAQSFSFDTWEATVSVSQAACDPDGPTTTIIHGSGFIALPTLGDDGSHGAPQIQVDFKLCETALRTAILSFDVSDEAPPLPPIPIGSTGLGVTLIGGVVDIGPDSTTITINLDFQSLDGQTLSNGKGSLTIDTAGLFELQGSGQFLKGVLEADMTLQVAWNPFDMLVEGEATCCFGGDLLSGTMRIHAWVGQGWQNKYAWLKDNDDFHFTGSIKATLKIKSGDVVDDWPFVLPPFTVSLTAEVAFGEFCANAACTDQTWGASATVKVLGYSVGMYVDSGGPELILGSNGHKLIDQHCCAPNQPLRPQLTTINAPEQVTDLQIIKPGQWQPYLSPPIQSPAAGWVAEPCTNASGSVHTCHFTVNAGTGRALFNINWQNGGLTIELLKPDNTVITAANAAAHGVTYDSGTGDAGPWASFAVADPPGGIVTPGVWKLRLSGVSSTTNYGLLFAAERPAPTVNWSFPVNDGETPGGSGNITLSWSASRGTEPLTPDVKAELFYVPLTQRPVTPTVMAGNVIVNGLAANAGASTWNLPAHGLAAGDYAVGLRLDDHANGNGHIVSWAPGSIHYEDTTSPPIPPLTGYKTLKDGLLVTWLRDDATPDLAGYLVEYTIPDYNPDAEPLSKVRRVLPSNPDWWPVLEKVRLGGLKNGWTTTVCVRAYDASGNMSDCTPTHIRLQVEPEIRLAAPEELKATPLSDHDVLLEWFPPTQGNADGYILNYAPYGCIVPGLDRSTESPPPPVVYDAGTYDSTIGGLSAGQTYRFLLRAYTNTGDISPPAVATARLLDAADGDGDELPDQWEALYAAFEADDDLDADGLDNYEEYLARTDPLKADSDFDGFYDAEEMEWGTDPCGASDQPPYHQQPKLVLMGPAALTFVSSVNAGPAPSEGLAVWNGGTGLLDWTAVSDASWLVLNANPDGDTGSLVLSADPSGLTPGTYTAEITIMSRLPAVQQEAGQPSNETIVLPVTFTVLPPKEFAIFLPALMKSP